MNKKMKEEKKPPSQQQQTFISITIAIVIIISSVIFILLLAGFFEPRKFIFCDGSDYTAQGKSCRDERNNETNAETFRFASFRGENFCFAHLWSPVNNLRTFHRDGFTVHMNTF